MQDQDDERVLVIDDSVKTYEYGSDLFGEGLCPRNKDEFVILTWKEGKIIVLDRDTLEFKEEFAMPSEAAQGWGITAVEDGGDGNYKLYMSDSTENMWELNGDDMTVTDGFVVKDQNGSPVKQVNEIQYVDGFIYGNIWYKDVIIKINP